jgi:hypothetical protein
VNGEPPEAAAAPLQFASTLTRGQHIFAVAGDWKLLADQNKYIAMNLIWL